MINLLQSLFSDQTSLPALQWTHPPLKLERLAGDGLRVWTPGRVDYFQDPAEKMPPADNAPFLWLPVRGDFVAQAHVKPSFITTWDAGTLMARGDSQHWAKLCYEKTDLGTTAAVSVVTKGVSDDANGVDLTTPDLWLQMVRVGNMFGLHYALDGQHWRMVRVFRLLLPTTVQVGLVAQCPAGPGAVIDFLSFTVQPVTVSDLRAGV